MLRIVSNPQSPDIGELLVQRGVLEPKDIELAIHYQNRQATQGFNQPLEQILVRLGLVDRYTLDQLLAETSRANQTSAVDESASFETLVHIQTQHIEKRLRLLQTAVEINQQIQQASTLGAVIRETTKLVVQHYEIDYASIFLWEDLTQTLRLSHSSSPIGEEIVVNTKEITPASKSSVGWAAKYRQACINNNINSESLAPYLFPNTQSEASIPIATGDGFIGVLEVQASQDNVFDENVVDSLLIVCNFFGHLAIHHQNQEMSKGILSELSMLYQANQGFANCQSREQVIKHCYKTIRQLPQTIYLFSVEGGELLPVTGPDGSNTNGQTEILGPISQLSLAALSDQFIFQEYLVLPKHIAHLGLPEAFSESVRKLGYQSITLVPIEQDQQLEALLFLCGDVPAQNDQNGLQQCQSLASMASAALDKVAYQATIERQYSQLLSETTLRAEHERIATDITTKLWSASGVETILRTALGELGSALNADSGMISLEMSNEG